MPLRFFLVSEDTELGCCWIILIDNNLQNLVFFFILFIMQTLDIVAENPDKFRVVALAAGSNVTLLADQVH